METIAAISVIMGFMSSITIAIDLTRHNQSMKIMNPVWILTGLWGGPIALVAYFWFGRRKGGKVKPVDMTSSNKMAGMAMDEMRGMSSTPKMQVMDKMQATKTMDGMGGMQMEKRPYWQSVTLSTLHCGAGCTLADLIGEWFLYFVAITIGGSLILGSVVTDYILALAIGVYFQYAAIRSMSGQGTKSTTIIKQAFRADVLSLTAWQVGMYGFMALAIFAIFKGQHLEKTSWLFWFMMQIAMLIGFMTALPMNILLIKLGIKKAM